MDRLPTLRAAAKTAAILAAVSALCAGIALLILGNSFVKSRPHFLDTAGGFIYYVKATDGIAYVSAGEVALWLFLTNSFWVTIVTFIASCWIIAVLDYTPPFHE
jgi:hypothetical protein